jgi:hypothetical protein
MLLFLGVLKSNWQLALALLLAIVGFAAWESEHALLTHAHSQNAKLTSELREANDAGLAQAQKAAAETAQQKAAADVIQAQLSSAYQAHTLTAAALGAAVVRYETLRGSCAVLPASPGAHGHPGTRPGAGGAGSPAATIGSLVAACQHDADELKACQAYAASCAAH